MNPEPRHPAASDGALDVSVSTGSPGLSVRRVRYEPHARQGRHHHDRTSLTLVFRGSLDEVVAGSCEHAGPLSVVFKPAGTVHANRVGPVGAATLQIEFDEGFIDGDASGVPADWGWAHAGPSARRFLELFARWSSGDDPEDALEDRVFDILAGFDGSEDGMGGRRPPGWLVDVVEEVEDTFRRPRSVRELARSAAVHPVALARAHRRHYGCSITERTRARRVREAAGLLSSAEETLSAIAFATGFSDQPHFTRIFRDETGLTPGSYRSLVRG
ncbi:MAG: helix-turn-helix transcriptional regulator [Gemmatimonadota bacterium]|nr:helix-turn-helix transcriptional regulator [Gemmatimonadota bacterium]